MVTYEALANVPFVGVLNSQETLGSLIALSKALKTHDGILERLLATSIQDGVDSTLFLRSPEKLLIFWELILILLI